MKTPAPLPDFARCSLSRGLRTARLLMTLVLALWSGASSARAVELTLAHFVTTNHPMHVDVFVPLASRLAADSGGQLTLKIVPALSDPTRMFERVTNHEADMVFGLPGYTPDQFLRTHLIELPDVAARPEQATRMLANALPRALAPDFAAVVPLGLWVNEPAVLLSRERAIRSLDDLVGLRVRAADAISARVLALWGATPVTLPANQVAAAMRDAQVDAALIGSSGILSFNLESVTRSCTVGLPVLLTSFYLLMNRQAWDTLDPAFQVLLGNATGPAFSQGATAAYQRAGQAGLTKLRETNIEVIELTPGMAAGFSATSRQAVAETLAALTSRGIDGQKVLDAFRPRLGLVANLGQFQVLLHGAAGLDYELSASFELKTWTSLETRTGDAAGEALWTLPASMDLSRFFRVEVR